MELVNNTCTYTREIVTQRPSYISFQLANDKNQPRPKKYYAFLTKCKPGISQTWFVDHVYQYRRLLTVISAAYIGISFRAWSSRFNVAKRNESRLVESISLYHCLNSKLGFPYKRAFTPIEKRVTIFEYRICLKQHPTCYISRFLFLFLYIISSSSQKWVYRFICSYDFIFCYALQASTPIEWGSTFLFSWHTTIFKCCIRE